MAGASEPRARMRDRPEAAARRPGSALAHGGWQIPVPHCWTEGPQRDFTGFSHRVSPQAAYRMAATILGVNRGWPGGGRDRAQPVCNPALGVTPTSFFYSLSQERVPNAATQDASPASAAHEPSGGCPTGAVRGTPTALTGLAPKGPDPGTGEQVCVLRTWLFLAAGGSGRPGPLPALAAVPVRAREVAVRGPSHPVVTGTEVSVPTALEQQAALPRTGDPAGAPLCPRTMPTLCHIVTAPHCMEKDLLRLKGLFAQIGAVVQQVGQRAVPVEWRAAASRLANWCVPGFPPPRTGSLGC